MPFNIYQKIRHLFVPHHSNNFRAKALHPSAFVFYIFFFLVLQFSFKVVRYNRGAVLGLSTDVTVDRLLTLTNQRRAGSSLGPLTLSSDLSMAAAAKASDMFSKNYWAHNAPDGKTPWDFITSAGYRYLYAGENLAKDFGDADSVVAAWMDSPTHRANILKVEYKEVGFAVVSGKLNGEDTLLVVQMFGTKAPNYIAENPSGEAAIDNSTPSGKTNVIAVTEKINNQIIPTNIPPKTSIGLTNLPSPNMGRSISAVFGKSKLGNFLTPRNISLLFTELLMILLVLDSLFIWRKKTIRVAGHNFAHVIFLAVLAGAIWLSGMGSII